MNQLTEKERKPTLKKIPKSDSTDPKRRGKRRIIWRQVHYSLWMSCVALWVCSLTRWLHQKCYRLLSKTNGLFKQSYSEKKRGQHVVYKPVSLWSYFVVCLKWTGLNKPLWGRGLGSIPIIYLYCPNFLGMNLLHNILHFCFSVSQLG